MTDIRSRLADALRRWDRAYVMPEQMADVLLALPGIAIVELPEPHEDKPIVKRAYWVGYKPGDFLAYAQADGVWLETDAKYRVLTPGQARSCAAALLAAAVQAQEEVG